MSSGRPLSGRFIITTGTSLPRAFSTALDWSPRARSMRFSTSRTLVRYSSSLVLSLPLTLRDRLAASSFTLSRMLWARRLPRFSNRLSKASDGYTSIGTGDSALCHEMCEL